MGAKEVLRSDLSVYEHALLRCMENSDCDLKEALQQVIQEAGQDNMPDQEGQIENYQQAARALRKKGC